MRRVYTSAQEDAQSKLGKAAAHIRKAMECLTDAYEDMDRDDDDTPDEEEDETVTAPKGRRSRYM